MNFRLAWVSILLLGACNLGNLGQEAIESGRITAPNNAVYGFKDNFLYSNGDLTSVSGGNWTNAASVGTELYVSANIVSISTSSTCATTYPCYVVWTGGGGPAPANQSTQVTFTGISSDFLGPAVRTSTASQTGYAALCTTTYGSAQCAIYKNANSTITALTAEGSTISTTSTVKLSVSGANPASLTLYVNGASYLTYSDSTSPIASGSWGLADVNSNGDTHISQAVGTSP